MSVVILLKTRCYIMEVSMSEETESTQLFIFKLLSFDMRSIFLIRLSCSSICLATSVFHLSRSEKKDWDSFLKTFLISSFILIASAVYAYNSSNLLVCSSCAATTASVRFSAKSKASSTILLDSLKIVSAACSVFLRN